MATLLTLIAATCATLALPATGAWAQEDGGTPLDEVAPDGEGEGEGGGEGVEGEDGLEDDGVDGEDGAEDGLDDGADDGFDDGADDGLDDGAEDDGFDDDTEVLDDSFESDTGAPVGGVDAGFGGAAGSENGLIALAAALLAAAGASHLWYRRSALQV